METSDAGPGSMERALQITVNIIIFNILFCNNFINAVTAGKTGLPAKRAACSYLWTEKDKNDAISALIS